MTHDTASADPRTRRLTEISRALTYARSLQDVLDLTAECATDLLDAPRALLMLNDDAGLLTIRASRGLDPNSVERFREPLDENLLTRLTGLLGPDAKDRFLGVPLVVRGGVIGLLGVVQEHGAHADDESEWLLSALADQAAVALESTRHQERRSALEERVEQLERIRVQKDQALEILSHDLRSPLNAIDGYVSLLAGEVLGPVNERQRESLVRIKRVSEHLQSILANVLEMARVAGGRAPVELKPIPVESVVAAAIEIIQPTAAAAGIAVHAGGDAVPPAKTDAERLRQVLVQLLDNAVKYSPDGSTVRVAWRSVQSGGRGCVEIAITDEGPGVPAEQHESIFEPYVRGGGSTHRAGSGVGLGLAIAKTIVLHLHGTLTLESRTGEGSTFRVRLPAAKD